MKQETIDVFFCFEEQAQWDLLKKHPEAPAQLWGEIKSFEELGRPSFPLERLPEVVRRYAFELAQDLQVPVDMTAMCVLSVLSICVQGKYKVSPKPGWVEPLNLFTLIIAPPGERKSPVFRKVTQPIFNYEWRKKKEMEPQILDSTAKRAVLSAKVEKLKKSVGRSEVADEEYRRAVKELNEFQEVTAPRLLADDTTPERLASLMSQNGGKMAVASAEGGIFEIIGGRYSGGKANMDIFLKGHDGDPVRVDRSNREEYIKEPILSVLLAAQPEVLNGIMGNAAFQGRGLVGRFLYCIPTLQGVRRFDSKPISQQTTEVFQGLCADLLKIPSKEAPVLRFGKQAMETFGAFYEEMDALTRGELSYMGDWMGKFCGAVARIAGVLYLAKERVFAEKKDVPLQVVEDAIAIGRYLMEHAKAAYAAMGAEGSVTGARYILERLEKKPQYRMKKYDILRLCRKIKTAEELAEPLDILCEMGYLHKEGSGGKPGRPSEVYYLNPAYFKL